MPWPCFPANFPFKIQGTAGGWVGGVFVGGEGACFDRGGGGGGEEWERLHGKNLQILDLQRLAPLQ